MLNQEYISLGKILSFITFILETFINDCILDQLINVFNYLLAL
jgi:hypothetical protein